MPVQDRDSDVPSPAREFEPKFNSNFFFLGSPGSERLEPCGCPCVDSEVCKRESGKRRVRQPTLQVAAALPTRIVGRVWQIEGARSNLIISTGYCCCQCENHSEGDLKEGHGGHMLSLAIRHSPAGRSLCWSQDCFLRSKLIELK